MRRAPEVSRDWSAEEHTAPPSRATSLGLPLLAFIGLTASVTLYFALAPGALDGPLRLSCEPLELVAALMAAALVWLGVAIVTEEGRLNARGETLFPKERRFDRRRVLARTDRALCAALRGLDRGEDAVAERLEAETHRGDALPEGRARSCYEP